MKCYMILSTQQFLRSNFISYSSIFLLLYLANPQTCWMLSVWLPRKWSSMFAEMSEFSNDVYRNLECEKSPIRSSIRWEVRLCQYLQLNDSHTSGVATDNYFHCQLICWFFSHNLSISLSQSPKMTSPDFLCCPQPKGIQFTAVEAIINQIYSHLKSWNIWTYMFFFKCYSNPRTNYQKAVNQFNRWQIID